MTHEEENYNGLVDALKVSEDENRKLIEALNKARKERDEAQAELAHIKAEYEKTNPSELTRDALVLQNAALQIKVERLQADLDVVDSDLSLAVKRLTADNNRLYDEKAKLRKALEGLFKPSTPYAQWTTAEHEAQIVLEQTGKKW